MLRNDVPPARRWNCCFIVTGEELPAAPAAEEPAAEAAAEAVVEASVEDEMPAAEPAEDAQE